jgi:dipeptidyl aminopeptidase/acylaminoacyl peptidase
VVRIALAVVVPLMVVALFSAAPSASADKIIFTNVDDRGGALVVMRPDGSVGSVARGFVHSFYDLSLDGRRLVASAGDLLVTPFTARDRLVVRRTRVLTRKNPGIWPRWSPNGRSVAGAREVGGSFQVFVLRLGGGRARRLRTSVSMKFPSWSPDGRRIVAMGERCEPLGFNCGEDFVTGLWVIDVATGAAREILYLDGESVGTPAWSPDGRWIAFTRQAPTTGLGALPPGSSQLWLVRPDGSGLRQLTHLTEADVVGPPAWSPNGRRLAFITRRDRFSWPVATIRANGSGLRTLFTRRGQNYGIDWSR